MNIIIQYTCSPCCDIIPAVTLTKFFMKINVASVCTKEKPLHDTQN